MPNIPISSLPTTTTVSPSAILILDQNGTTYQGTVAQILTNVAPVTGYVSGGGSGGSGGGTSQPIYSTSSSNIVSDSSETSNPTPIPNLSVTLPAQSNSITAYVSTSVIFHSDHNNRFFIYLDGQEIFPSSSSYSSTGFQQSVSSDDNSNQGGGKASLTISMVPITIPGDNQSHAVSIYYAVEDSVDALTWFDRSLTVILNNVNSINASSVSALPTLVNANDDGDQNSSSHNMTLSTTCTPGNILLVFSTHSTSATVSVPHYTLIGSSSQNGYVAEIWGRVADGSANDAAVVSYSATGTNNQSWFAEYANAQIPTIYSGGSAGAYFAFGQPVNAPASSLVFGLFSQNSTSTGASSAPGSTLTYIPETNSQNSFLLTTTPIYNAAGNITPGLSWASQTGAALSLVLTAANPSPVSQITYTYSNPIDVPPSASSAYDDEFTASTLNSNWSIINGGSKTDRTINIDTKGSGFVLLEGPTPGTNNELYGIYKNGPTTPFTVTAKLSCESPYQAYIGPGLFIGGTSGIRTLFVMGRNPNNNTSTPLFDLCAYHTSGSYNVDNATGCPANPSVGYFRIKYDGTNLTFNWSATGHFPSVPIFSEAASAYVGAPNNFGIGFISQGYPCFITCDWIRVTTP